MALRPLLLCLFALPLSAAVVTATPMVLPPPSIKAASEQPIELAAYSLTAQVHGLYAECTATMVFRNPNARVLEGELEFPLPDHATVSGYALDIGGKLVEGVIVGKDQARVVLEAERRRGVDPGLVEVVRGNLFRTRVYPVPQQGQRTVAVTWVQELALAGEEAALRLALPRCRLPMLGVHLEVAAGSSAPAVSGFGNLTLTAWQGHSRADATLADVLPDDDLLVRLQHVPDQLVLVEEHAGERFIAISDRPAVLAPAKARPPPARIAVAWDASASRSADAIARNREFLRSWCARCPGCAVDLVVFRDVPQPAQSFGDAASLLNALDHLAYDGGTGLARLDLRRAALPHPDDRCWVLLSDGLGTVGEGLPATDAVAVYCPLADRVNDAAFLRLLAARSGGALLDLIDGGAGAAIEAILQPPPTLLRVDAAPGVLGDLQTSFRGGRATVLARLLGEGAVDLVYGSARQDGAHTLLRVGAGAPATGGVIARAWAGARAADLGVFAEANRGELISLGQRYHLVTPGTALLVLENLDQYIRHHIAPPESLADMRQQYDQQLKARGQAWQANGQQQRERVVAWWRDRVAWWNPGSPLELAQVPAGGATPPPPLAPTVPPAAGIAERKADDTNDHRLRQALGGNAQAAAAPSTLPVQEDLSGREEAVASSDLVAGATATFGAIGAGGGSGRRARQAMSGMVANTGGMPGTISITPFDPATPYLTAIKQAAPEQAYATYLGQVQSWRDCPSFYLDCAGFFFPRDAALARRVLSNLAESRLDDPALLRIFAWRLQEAGDLDLAVAVLRHVLTLRPEEPQSYRDLALALGARGEAGKRGGDLGEAMGLLYRVVMRQPLEEVQLGEQAVLDQAWNRFPQVEIIALEELNRLLAVAERGSFDQPPVVPPLDPRLRQNLDCDLRVVMSWDADATDIDLHVSEPSGEEANYAHQHTRSGGLVSCDMTQGYGPEEYLLHHAPAGTYAIRCHYFATRRQTLLGPATVSAMAITNWGRVGERRQQLTLRLDKSGEFQFIGAISMGAGGGGVPPEGQGAAAVTRELLQQLVVGQHRAEVEARLGAPLRVDHDGVTVLVYHMANGALSRLGFGPDLLWAREVLAGAERDLLPH